MSINKQSIMNTISSAVKVSSNSVKTANKRQPSSKDFKPKASVKSKKTPNSKKANNSVRTVDDRLLWLKMVTREATHDGFFKLTTKKNMYVEVDQQYLTSIMNGQSRSFKRNVLKIYFDRNNKEQLDRLAAVHGAREFVWFTRKPDIVITDFAMRGERNTVMVKNPSDFYKYVEWAIKHADYVKNNWR